MQAQYTPTGVINENTPPMQSSQAAVDIPGFFDLVEKAMALYIKSKGPPDQTTPVLVHEFPKERLASPDTKFDVITYKVASSQTASSLNDGAAPRNPKLRQVKGHPDLGRKYTIAISGWRELVQAEFCIWSKSSRNAFLIADWFHVMMLEYAFIYKLFASRGVQIFRFVKRADDEVDHSFGQELYKCRLTYEFRLERLFALEQRMLTDLDILYGISGVDSEITLEPSQ